MGVQVLLAGLGMVCSIVVWRFIWLPTILSWTRDRLFDLRDKTLREFFVGRESGLEHHVYVNLRKLINGHLRHTESLSYWELIHLSASLDKHPELRAKLIEDRNALFYDDDANVRDLTEKVRLDSARILRDYAILTSSVIMMGSLIMAPLFFVIGVIRGGTQIVRNAFLPDFDETKVSMEEYAFQ